MMMLVPAGLGWGGGVSFSWQAGRTPAFLSDSLPSWTQAGSPLGEVRDGFSAWQGVVWRGEGRASFQGARGAGVRAAGKPPECAKRMLGRIRKKGLGKEAHLHMDGRAVCFLWCHIHTSFALVGLRCSQDLAQL